MKYIASVSFGKDSLAMLLILIARGYPLDEALQYVRHGVVSIVRLRSIDVFICFFNKA